MAISNAISSDRRSLAVGYELLKGNFAESTALLPQRVVLLGEANTANQETLDTDPYQITSASDAGEKYGYGSPLYLMARIFFPPLGGSGIGGIPVIAIPQSEAETATAAERTLTVTGTPTKNVTHKLYINGRNQIDGKLLDISITTTDTPTTIGNKIVTSISGILGMPVTAVNASGVITLTTKWASATAKIDIEVVTDDEDAGLSYAVGSLTAGTGAADISDALLTFGEEWTTIVVNSYGTSQFSVLEAHNGTPDSKTGRYDARVWKPYIAIWGSSESDSDTLIAITDASERKSEVTNALFPAPNTKAYDFEIAADGALQYALISQSAPETDVAEKPYNDIPIPLDGKIGDMQDSNVREQLIDAGCSTAIIKNGNYQIMDFVTTYHPDNDSTYAYSFCRNLMIDFNFKYAHSLRQLATVKGNALGDDNQTYTTSNVIKPKAWKQELYALFEDLAAKALITDVDFSKESVLVKINNTPDRLDDFMRYKRTGYARILSTTVEAGFQLGNV